MNFEPKIVGLLCNWCSYAGADLAGISRTKYPPNIRVVRLMCSGKVAEKLLADLTSDIQRGRSTDGPEAQNDVADIVLWKSRRAQENFEGKRGWQTQTGGLLP